MTLKFMPFFDKQTLLYYCKELIITVDLTFNKKLNNSAYRIFYLLLILV